MGNNENMWDMLENPKITLFKMAVPTFISFGCILLNSFLDLIWVSGLDIGS